MAYTYPYVNIHRINMCTIFIKETRVSGCINWLTLIEKLTVFFDYIVVYRIAILVGLGIDVLLCTPLTFV